ncbi:MAG: hypothetical protein LBQ54_05645 [Planctomycetaceae bacterium]|nr:hypothetical protein [Planctomycetaceae bacterium]
MYKNRGSVARSRAATANAWTLDPGMLPASLMRSLFDRKFSFCSGNMLLHRSSLRPPVGKIFQPLAVCGKAVRFPATNDREAPAGGLPSASGGNVIPSIDSSD